MIARQELRIFLRQPLTWAVLAALFAAMLVGAAGGEARAEREASTLARIGAEERAAVGAARAAAARYAEPSDLVVDYHRDPSDVFGYMTYFLVAHAVAPPTPLAALAVGQADLFPPFVRIDFTSTFPDAAYELSNPRGLKVGAFDLAFVLAYLVPLAVIALAGFRLSGERDAGILRLMAAQPVGLRKVAWAKFGAVGAATSVIVPVLAGLALLCVGGLPASAAWLGVLALLGLALAGYVALWFGLCALVASLWRGAVQSAVLLSLAWLAMTLLVPALAVLILALAAPPPSRIAYVEASRRVMDDFYKTERAVYAAYLAARPAYADGLPQAIDSPQVKRFAREELYGRQLAPFRQAFAAHAARLEQIGGWLRLASPALALDHALQIAAGTEPQGRRRLLDQAADYTTALRAHFEPLALEEAARPSPFACAGCPGRDNFTAYDDVPRFAPRLDPRPARVAAGWAAAYLWLAAALAAVVARARLRDWPAGG